MRKALRLCFAAMIFSTALPALAIDYTDWWWNPSQSGQGINVGQQGNIVFIAWFTYDEQGNGMWLVFSGAALPGPTGTIVTGTLYRTTGPALGTPFDPTKVVATAVGTGTLTFMGAHNATLDWSVNSKSGTIALVRETYGSTPPDGTYQYYQVGRALCDNFPISHPGIMTITTNGNQYSAHFSHTDDSSLQCNLTGTITQSGRFLSASGQNFCNAGSGTFSLTMLVLERATVIWETRSVGNCVVQSQWAMTR
jgi:hypothetical protein